MTDNEKGNLEQYKQELKQRLRVAGQAFYAVNDFYSVFNKNKDLNTERELLSKAVESMPVFGEAAMFFLDHIGVKEEDVVLDPYTGCGVDAIFAVLKGASRAVAIDKNPMAYLCARYNVNRLGLEKKIKVKEGDWYAGLKEAPCKFDLVVANPPFGNILPHSEIEKALNDYEYQNLKLFFDSIGDHLNPNGRIRMVFSDVGNRYDLENFADKNKLTYKIVASTIYASEVGIYVYEMRFKDKSKSDKINGFYPVDYYGSDKVAGF